MPCPATVRAEGRGGDRAVDGGRDRAEPGLGRGWAGAGRGRGRGWNGTGTRAGKRAKNRLRPQDFEVFSRLIPNFGLNAEAGSDYEPRSNV